MDGIQFAALYTLHHGLTGHAETLHGLEHRDITGRCLFHEPGAKGLRDTDAPWGTRSDLFTVDESVIEPSMHRRGCDAKYFGGLGDIDQLAIGGRGRRIEARNVPVAAEIAHAVDIEGMAVGSCPALTIENGGNHRIGMEPSQAADEIDGVVVGTNGRPPFPRAVEFDVGQQPGPPAQGELDVMLSAWGKDDDLFQHRAQQLLLVPRRRRGRIPGAREMLGESPECIAPGGVELVWPVVLTPLQLALRFFERDQTLFPFLLQSTRDKTMLWLDSTVPALGLLGLVARARPSASIA